MCEDFNRTPEQPVLWAIVLERIGKSPAGLHDMSGNVWEWVADGHDMSFYGKSPERDPKGPTAVKNRVTRGGSWNDFDPKFLRATVRPGFGPDNRFANVGFRCAKDDAAKP